MNFTVTRFGGTAAFTVNYATAANTASGAGGDYIATGAHSHSEPESIRSLSR